MSAPFSESAMWQLVLYRLRALYREPAVLFWVFGFPLLTSLALGLAFRSERLKEISVAVAEGDKAWELSLALDAAEGLSAVRLSLPEAKDQLRRGEVALVVIPGERPTFVSDPTQRDGRTAELLVRDEMERRNGRADTLAIAREEMVAPGARYIDFLVPGLLGMALMSSGVWGVGWVLVQMRSGRLLKRLSATPMKRSQFLFSFVVVRLLLALVEIFFFIAFAYLLFDVRIFGSPFAFFGVGLFGSLAFSGLGLLVASRARNSETASGLMNMLTMPMMGLSGVFFSASYFPQWMQPLVKALPLTALNDALRAILVDGAPAWALWAEGLVLGVWGLSSYLLALRIFRWQ